MPSRICAWMPTSPRDDGLIAALIVTARQQAEHRTGRALVTQQWRLGLDRFADDSLELTLPKLQSVQSVTYLDADGVRQTLVSAEYDVVIPTSWSVLLLPAFGKTWPDCRIRRLGAGELHLRLRHAASDVRNRSRHGCCWPLAHGTKTVKR